MFHDHWSRLYVHYGHTHLMLSCHLADIHESTWAKSIEVGVACFKKLPRDGIKETLYITLNELGHEYFWKHEWRAVLQSVQTFTL